MHGIIKIKELSFFLIGIGIFQITKRIKIGQFIDKKILFRDKIVEMLFHQI